MLFGLVLSNLIKSGTLRVIDAGGRMHTYGDGQQPAATVRLHDPKLHTRLFLNPRLYVGEAYMDGKLTVEAGTFRDVMTLFCKNLGASNEAPTFVMRLHEKLGFLTHGWQEYNPLKSARAHVAHHYDLSDTLYELFLDKDMQYSCGYFASEQDTLEDAQLYKKRHIASKLDLHPGQRVLDIGCGWGGMTLYLAREFGVQVTGLTLSERQLTKARARAAQEGLEKQVTFELCDYRQQQGEFDRIVSVGMFEHVGRPHYGDFFAKLKSLLKSDGIALLHAIGRMEKPGSTNPWLRKYIFPGGYSPALSEVLPAIENNNLWVCDMEILRMHYALTIEQWYRRFMANRERIAAIYDERFCRMWEFYLLGVEMEFRYVTGMVFQFQLTREKNTLPITRDYMLESERALGALQKPLRRAVN